MIERSRSSRLPSLRRRQTFSVVLVGACLLAGLAIGGSEARAVPANQAEIVFVKWAFPLLTTDYEVWKTNADGSGQTRLTRDPVEDNQPAVSPDGRKIVFIKNRQIHLMNADGTGVVRLTTNLAADNKPAFSPDGSKIVFATDRDGNFEIYLMNLDGSGQTNISRHVSRDYNPSFSPDGSKIIFESDRGGGGSGTSCSECGLSDIYTMRIDGSGVTNITKDAANDDLYPAFSPDGRTITFTKVLLVANYEIYAMNADGSGQRNLTNHPAIDSQSDFSPDGRKITFTTYRNGVANQQLYTVNPDGSGVSRLMTNADADFRPDWGGPVGGVAAQPGGGGGRVTVTGGCLNMRLGVGARRVGDAVLGRSRRSHRRIFRGARRRSRPGIDRYCTVGGGLLRIGYPTRRLNRGLTRSTRMRIRGRAVLILTSSRLYAVRGIRRGSSTRSVRARLRRERRFRVGRNTWYVAPGRASQLVVKTRNGRVLEVGLATKRLANTRPRARRLLRAWQL